MTGCNLASLLFLCYRVASGLYFSFHHRRFTLVAWLKTKLIPAPTSHLELPESLSLESSLDVPQYAWVSLKGHAPTFLGGVNAGIFSLVLGDLVVEVCLMRTGHSPSAVWRNLGSIL